MPIANANALAVKSASSLAARGLSRLGELPPKDLDFEMGHNHWAGINCYEQSYELAIEYFRKSAAKNNYEAMCDLAQLLSYHLGCGCSRDDNHTCEMDESAQLEAWENRVNESVGWLHKAALANYPRAQCELPGSYCYCDDETECGEISCSLDKSGWLEKAAAQGYPPAFLKLAFEKYPQNANHYFEQLERLDIVHPKYAQVLFELAAHHIQMATYKNRKDVNKIDKGIRLYLKAAKLGHFNAQMRLAEHLSENKICAADFEKAFFWCCKANESGYGEAYFLLATFYENGLVQTSVFQKPLNIFKSL